MSNFPSILFLLLLSTPSLLPVLAATDNKPQCFYPPHANNPDSPFPQPHDTPCNPARAHPSATPPTHSPCCAPEDICLANGLCYRPDINRLHRGSCTDPTFAAPACSKACTAPGTHPAGWADVLECTGGEGEGEGRGRGNWYCGLGNSSACERGMTFRLGDGLIADFRGGRSGQSGRGKNGDAKGKGKVAGSGKGDADGEGGSEEGEAAMTVTTTEAVAPSSASSSSSSVATTTTGSVSGNATVSASGTSAPAASATNGAGRVLGGAEGMAAIGLLGVAAAFVAVL